MVRVISWNVPANIVGDPAGPTMGKNAIRDVAQIHNAGKLRLTEFPSSMPVAARDNADKTNNVMILSYPVHKSIDLRPTDRPVSRHLFPMAMMQPEVAGYRLQPGASRKQAVSLSPGIEPNMPPVRNLAVKQRRNGIGGYSWVFARQASQGMDSEAREGGAAISNGQYGGSQTGVILSYPILTGPDPELAVYGRLTAALAPLAQEEIALGVRMHPVHNFPFSIHAEQRLAADSGGDRGTAFYVAGGTGPDHIIEKIALETYVQAGYVLGKNETHFFDGSAILQRPITVFDRKKLSVGAGVWAGGQRKITRLDVGPRADISLPLRTTSVRLAVDWRVRVAGNARPENGLAITVSTGF